MKIKLRQKTGTGIVVVLVAAAFLLTAIVPSTVGASPWSDSPGKRGGRPGKGYHQPALGIWQDRNVVEQLDLTEEQVQQLRDADFTSREKRLALKSQLDHLRLQMDKIFSNESRDEKTVRQLAEKTADFKGQMFIQQIEDHLVLATILTSDQIQKLETNNKHRKRGRSATGKHSDAKGRFAARFDDGVCRGAR